MNPCGIAYDQLGSERYKILQAKRALTSRIRELLPYLNVSFPKVSIAPAQASLKDVFIPVFIGRVERPHKDSFLSSAKEIIGLKKLFFKGVNIL